jgi:hypothetical protein
LVCRSLRVVHKPTRSASAVIEPTSTQPRPQHETSSAASRPSGSTSIVASVDDEPPSIRVAVGGRRAQGPGRASRRRAGGRGARRSARPTTLGAAQSRAGSLPRRRARNSKGVPPAPWKTTWLARRWECLPRSDPKRNSCHKLDG